MAFALEGSMNKLALGRRIHNARKERGLTSEKLSELCDINATYLRQIESGVKTPSLQVFVTICQQLSVSPHYLLAEELVDVSGEDITGLLKLLEEATPRQTELIAAMIRSALNALTES